MNFRSLLRGFEPEFGVPRHFLLKFTCQPANNRPPKQKSYRPNQTSNAHVAAAHERSYYALLSGATGESYPSPVT